jgi:hypothetical protein
VILSEDVSLDTTGATGVFEDANAGTGKTVFVSGIVTTGADKGNYSLTQPTTTADITKATPTLSVTNSPIIATGVPVPVEIGKSVPGTVSDIKYNGSSIIPTEPGIYAITADFTPDDATNYESLDDASAGDFVIHFGVYLPLAMK